MILQALDPGKGEPGASDRAAGTEAAIAGVGSSPVPTWEEVAREHGRFVYRVAYRLTGDRDDAEDLTQEVLLRVRRGLPSFRPGSMEAWLSRITTNVFLDEVRRRRRRPARPAGEDLELLTPQVASAADVFDSSSLSADVADALRRLPDEYRIAVVLCDVAGLSYAEIAESLRVPVGTVRSRIHRGRALLRGALV